MGLDTNDLFYVYKVFSDTPCPVCGADHAVLIQSLISGYQRRERKPKVYASYAISRWAARRRSNPISSLYFGLNLLAINTNYVGLILDLNIDFYTLENVF